MPRWLHHVTLCLSAVLLLATGWLAANAIDAADVNRTAWCLVVMILLVLGLLCREET